MRFTLTDEISFPRELVFSTLRDRTLDLLEWMPNVDTIDVLEERFDGGVKHSVKRWRGSSDEIPGPARPLIKPELLSWIDHAIWDSNSWTCTWRHEFPALPGGISANGVNRYEMDGDVTIIYMEGSFDIHPEGLTFVPQFVARKAAPVLERFIIGRIKPNMRASNEAVEEFLEDEQG